ncbi:hypothetical protein ACJ73_09625, partial [Blastomyces percursus]
METAQAQQDPTDPERYTKAQFKNDCALLLLYKDDFAAGRSLHLLGLTSQRDFGRAEGIILSLSENSRNEAFTKAHATQGRSTGSTSTIPRFRQWLDRFRKGPQQQDGSYMFFPPLHPSFAAAASPQSDRNPDFPMQSPRPRSNSQDRQVIHDRVDRFHGSNNLRPLFVGDTRNDVSDLPTRNLPPSAPTQPTPPDSQNLPASRTLQDNLHCTTQQSFGSLPRRPHPNNNSRNNSAASDPSPVTMPAETEQPSTRSQRSTRHPSNPASDPSDSSSDPGRRAHRRRSSHRRRRSRSSSTGRDRHFRHRHRDDADRRHRPLDTLPLKSYMAKVPPANLSSVTHTTQPNNFFTLANLSALRLVRKGKYGYSLPSMSALSPILAGPFDIIERVGPLAYRLSLPPELDSIHPVVSVLHLEKFEKDPFGRPHPIPPTEIINGIPRNEIEQIIAERKDAEDGTPLLLARWAGYPDAPDSWEPRSHLMEDCPRLVRLFDKEQRRRRRQNGQISSVRAASKLYSVPRTTLGYRIQGRTTRVDTPSKHRKLSPTEEESLVQWILVMDERGQPPRVGTVREMANILLANRDPSAEARPPTVGKSW